MTSPIFGSFDGNWLALLNESGKRAALVVFPVSQDHARLARRDHIEPSH